MDSASIAIDAWSSSTSDGSESADGGANVAASDGGEIQLRVLDISEKYHYTIPSFSAIDMQLQHVVVECWELNTIDYLDTFFRVERDLLNLHLTLPVYATIHKGCIVPVSV